MQDENQCIASVRIGYNSNRATNNTNRKQINKWGKNYVTIQNGGMNVVENKEYKRIQFQLLLHLCKQQKAITLKIK